VPLWLVALLLLIGLARIADRSVSRLSEALTHSMKSLVLRETVVKCVLAAAGRRIAFPLLPVLPSQMPTMRPPLPRKAIKSRSAKLTPTGTRFWSLRHSVTDSSGS
jgi:hypothetical protein